MDDSFPRGLRSWQRLTEIITPAGNLHIREQPKRFTGAACSHREKLKSGKDTQQQHRQWHFLTGGQGNTHCGSLGRILFTRIEVRLNSAALCWHQVITVSNYSAQRHYFLIIVHEVSGAILSITNSDSHKQAIGFSFACTVPRHNRAKPLKIPKSNPDLCQRICSDIGERNSIYLI